MVDALISAAAESDCSLDDIMTFDISNDERPPARFCEFCHSSNTPTWRRGPSGKGSLCNACGIKWRLRKRLKKNEKGSPSPPLTPDKKMSPLVKQSKKRKERDGFSRPSKSRVDINDNDQDFSPADMKRKKYYCKYCDQTFSFSQFRNSQQFGAHCSNCSRRPLRADDLSYDRDDYVYNDRSPETPPLTMDRGVSSPESPASPISVAANPRDGLLLRLLYVVEHQLVDVNELDEIRDEITTLKTELITREEARKVELTLLSARFKEDLAELKNGLHRSVAAHEELAARRLMEMESTIRRNAEF